MSGPVSEIGRELKVSELKPRTIVWLFKEGREVAATLWVVEIRPASVRFLAGKFGMEFLAKRCGPDLEQIADEDSPMHVFEYLGEP